MWQIDIAETGYMVEYWLAECHTWHHQLPQWLRSRAIAQKAVSLDTFIDHYRDAKIFWGVDNRSQHSKAVVIGEQITVDTMEGHLFCSRHASPELVAAIIRFGVQWVLKNTDIERIICVVRTRHWGLKKIVEDGGLIKTGYSMWDAAAADGSMFEGQVYVTRDGKRKKN